MASLLKSTEDPCRQERLAEIGRRFLEGHPPYILTASLKGPFERSSGFVNPWIPKMTTPDRETNTTFGTGTTTHIASSPTSHSLGSDPLKHRSSSPPDRSILYHSNVNSSTPHPQISLIALPEPDSPPVLSSSSSSNFSPSSVSLLAGLSSPSIHPNRDLNVTTSTFLSPSAMLPRKSSRNRKPSRKLLDSIASATPPRSARRNTPQRQIDDTYFPDVASSPPAAGSPRPSSRSPSPVKNGYSSSLPRRSESPSIQSIQPVQYSPYSRSSPLKRSRFSQFHDIESDSERELPTPGGDDDHGHQYPRRPSGLSPNKKPRLLSPSRMTAKFVGPVSPCAAPRSQHPNAPSSTRGRSPPSVGIPSSPPTIVEASTCIYETQRDDSFQYRKRPIRHLKHRTASPQATPLATVADVVKDDESDDGIVKLSEEHDLTARNKPPSRNSPSTKPENTIRHTRPDAKIKACLSSSPPPANTRSVNDVIDDTYYNETYSCLAPDSYLLPSSPSKLGVRSSTSSPDVDSSPLEADEATSIQDTTLTCNESTIVEPKSHQHEPSRCKADVDDVDRGPDSDRSADTIGVLDESDTLRDTTISDTSLTTAIDETTQSVSVPSWDIPTSSPPTSSPAVSPSNLSSPRPTTINTPLRLRGVQSPIAPSTPSSRDLSHLQLSIPSSLPAKTQADMVSEQEDEENHDSTLTEVVLGNVEITTTPLSKDSDATPLSIFPPISPDHSHSCSQDSSEMAEVESPDGSYVQKNKMDPNVEPSEPNSPTPKRNLDSAKKPTTTEDFPLRPFSSIFVASPPSQRLVLATPSRIWGSVPSHPRSLDYGGSPLSSHSKPMMSGQPAVNHAANSLMSSLKHNPWSHNTQSPRSISAASPVRNSSEEDHRQAPFAGTPSVKSSHGVGFALDTPTPTFRQRNALPRPEKLVSRRVTWAPLPGEETEPHSTSCVGKSESSGEGDVVVVAHADMNIGTSPPPLVTSPVDSLARKGRAKSPPPPLLSDGKSLPYSHPGKNGDVGGDLLEVTSFQAHFQAVGRIQKSPSAPTDPNQKLLPSHSQQFQLTQENNAMAEAFVAADTANKTKPRNKSPDVIIHQHQQDLLYGDKENSIFHGDTIEHVDVVEDVLGNIDSFLNVWDHDSAMANSPSPALATPQSTKGLEPRSILLSNDDLLGNRLWR